MQKFTDTITAAGNGGVLTPLANASVTVYVTGTNTLAPLYSDNGVTAKTNPFTSTGTGLVEFYAPDDRYDIVVAKTGFSTVTVADIIFEDIDDVIQTDISHAAITDSEFSNGTVANSAVQNSTLSANTIIDGTMDGTTATGLDISTSAIDESDITGGTANDVAITGSTVNSTPVGAAAPSTGKFTSVQLASGATGTIGFGEIRLNQTELTLDVGMSGGVVGQMFEEHFIAFSNTSGQAMTSGQVVGFAGVDNVNSIPYGQLVTANPAYNPLYTMGIVTQDIGDGAYGRATMFGKVRNINTTGFQVSEVWAPGDLLYIHPTIPGAMTNIEPAVPSQSLLMAAVLRVGATTGTILVRPQLTAHMHYATYASHVTQTLTTALTPKAVAFEVVDTESGPTIVDNTKIYPQQAGLQDFGFAGQLAKSSANTSYVWVWGRKNGVDIPDSAKKVSIAGSGTNAVIAWDFMVPMETTDYFEVMWTSDSTGVTLAAVPQETFCPSIPSAQISVKLSSH